MNRVKQMDLLGFAIQRYASVFSYELLECCNLIHLWIRKTELPVPTIDAIQERGMDGLSFIWVKARISVSEERLKLSIPGYFESTYDVTSMDKFKRRAPVLFAAFADSLAELNTEF